MRLKFADKQGFVQCYTCVSKLKVAEMQCGHFISRYNKFLRFDERNCRPQCKYCNETKKGNLYIFAINLEEEHKGITDILYEESKIIYKYSRDELIKLKTGWLFEINKMKS